MPENDELKKYLDYDGLDYLIKRIPRTRIIVTFDDVFAGETATCSLGTTVYTNTVPVTEPYQLVFSVVELGTWTIATSYLGDDYGTTVEVTGVGTTATGHVSYVSEIDGATVEPTDDITTWLKCANIEDSSITTLADVLANRSLFETLIANSNACKYMARSTTWAGNRLEGAIPAMTSNTTPSGEVIINGAYQGDSGHAYYICDGVDSSFAAVLPATGNYLGYLFTESKSIRKITLTAFATGTWTIQGKVSDSWVDIQTITVINGQSYSYDISSNAKYDGIRFYVPSDQSATSMGFYSIQVYDKDHITTNNDPMALIGKYGYCSNTLLSNATWAEAIANSDYFEEVLNVKNPVMTSDTAPSGTCIYGSCASLGSHPAWHAFDADQGSWFQPNSSIANSSWVGYIFTSPVNIHKAVIKHNQAANIYIEASNDGTTWVLVSDTVAVDHATYKDIKINTNGVAYDRYRAVSSTYTGIYDLKFYGRASSEVYVPLVPTMTSNTTPSGECSASSEGVYYSNTRYAYFAFNGETSGWVPNSAATNNHIQYTFPTAVKANAVKMTIETTLSSRVFDRTFTILASNDNFVSDSHELGSVEFNSMTGSNIYTKQVSFVNDVAYTSYRLFCSDQLGSSGSWMIYTYGIQFYQKQVQTNIIHSAANDTIYMMNNGAQIPLCTTNSNGDGILYFTQFTDGTYTLYSSVAKDPTNLSNNYSKSVRITKTSYGCTTEVYLIPDTVKTLYWWGYMGSKLEEISTANGWSGLTFQSPVFNTNSITMGTTGNNSKVCGVGTKSTISGTFKLIAHALASGGGQYGGTDKASVDSPSPVASINNASDEVLSIAITSKNAFVWSYGGTTNSTSALWLE